MFGKEILCRAGEDGKRKTLAGYNGAIQCPTLNNVCPRDEAKPLYCDNGDWKNYGNGGYCECWPGYAGDRCQKRFKKRHPRGCHHEDADLRIKHRSIPTSDNSKVIKTIGGLGPRRGEVNWAQLYWNNYNRNGCNAQTAAARGKIVVVWAGDCDVPVKARNAEYAGAVGLVLISSQNFRHTEIAPAPGLRITVRKAGAAFGQWLQGRNPANIQAAIKCPDFSTTSPYPSGGLPVPNPPSPPRPNPAPSPPRPLPTPKPTPLPPTVYKTVCDMPLYPTQYGRPRAGLTEYGVFFPTNSMGASFTPRVSVVATTVRFVAELGRGISGKFNLYKYDNSGKAVKVAESQNFQGKGSSSNAAQRSWSYYQARFSTPQLLQAGRTYAVSVWINNLFPAGQRRPYYKALLFVRDKFDSTWANGISLAKARGNSHPNIPNYVAPMIEVCSVRRS